MSQRGALGNELCHVVDKVLGVLVVSAFLVPAESVVAQIEITERRLADVDGQALRQLKQQPRRKIRPRKVQRGEELTLHLQAAELTHDPRIPQVHLAQFQLE